MRDSYINMLNGFAVICMPLRGCLRCDPLGEMIEKAGSVMSPVYSRPSMQHTRRD